MEYEIAWKDSKNDVRRMAFPFYTVAVYAVSHILRAGGSFLRIRQNGYKLTRAVRKQMISEAIRM